MNCPDPLELSSYFDEELPDARSEPIERHLRECHDCRAILDGWAAARASLDGLPVEGESKRQILAKIQKRYSARSLSVSIPIAAAALLTLALSLLLNLFLLAGMWQPFPGEHAGSASAPEYRVEAVEDPVLQRTLEHYKLRSKPTILVRPASDAAQPRKVGHEDE